jgi:hypothetical protein
MLYIFAFPLFKTMYSMKKVFLAAALIGMTSFAFGQQQQTASGTSSKDAKCSKSCMKSCGKSCKKGSCTNASKTTGSAPASTTGASTPTK